MSSYSRNSRKPIQALQLALAAALLAGSAAHAADEPRTFELTAISNGTGGEIGRASCRERVLMPV